MISYVLPLRCETCADDCHGELATYLRGVAPAAEVLLVDGSPPGVAASHALAFAVSDARLLPPDRDVAHVANGKVAGVTTGLRHASHDRVVIADDDVRYSLASLEDVVRALDDAELVLPQNVFAGRPLPWHAHWDGARSLVARVAGPDFPGTLAVRRSAFLAVGGYDGDVLFENLELVRTLEAAGHRVSSRPDIAVDRLPPPSRGFLGQRVRQAYDEFARPIRLLLALALIPALLACGLRWPVATPAVFVLASVALAEAGRRRHGGRAMFAPVTPLFAPLWMLERGCCAWIAVASRVVLGGCRYRGLILTQSATPRRSFRRRSPARLPHERRFRASRRTMAWSSTAHIGRAARSPGEP